MEAPGLLLLLLLLFANDPVADDPTDKIEQ
jgi:hypothetical protein